MKEDIIPSLYRLLQLHPHAEEVLQFEKRAAHDKELLSAWHDFLVEQSFEDRLSVAWKAYLQAIPAINERIAFQRKVQQDVRELHARDVRAEITHALPKRQIQNFNIKPFIGRTSVRIAAAAAILICAVLVWKLFVSDEQKLITASSDVPKIMVEDFVLEGISEDQIVDEFAQRLPAKLSVASGLYPITSYAVDHALGRVKAKRVASTLEATHKLIGKFSETGEQLHLEASLVDIKSKNILWKELFHTQQDPKALDDLEDQVSLRIVNALNANVSTESRLHMMQEVSTNALAVQLFLAGERAWAERSEASLRNSIRLLHEALAIDSTSTIISGYLALAYETFADNDYGDSTEHANAWIAAEQEAKRTLRMDSINPEALIVLGYVSFVVNDDYVQAADFFERAIKVKPSDAKVHQAIAELHLNTGKIELGKNHIVVARAIEPEHRVVRWIETKYLTALGRLEDARIAADDLIAMYPDYLNIKNFYWQYYLSKQEHKRALAAIPDYIPDMDWREKYMQAMVHVDQKNYAAMHAIFPDDSKRSRSFDLLEHVQKDEWEEAYTLLRHLLENDAFELLPLSQTSDFEMFNKLKENPGMQAIFREFGITINFIPREPEI